MFMSDTANTALSKRFVYWQCQIRKHSARELEYRPTTGICPEIFVNNVSLGFLTTLLVPSSPTHDISHLKHVYNKTHDPKKRREDALKYLQSEFYQVTDCFNGELTALAAKNVPWVEKVLSANTVKLIFEQHSKQWQVPCDVQRLKKYYDLRWQFTLAHNQLFNHALTTDIQVLMFDPLWGEVKEESLPGS